MTRESGTQPSMVSGRQKLQQQTASGIGQLGTIMLVEYRVGGGNETEAEYLKR